MGRGYIVEEQVQKYLSSLTAAGAASLTGLLLGQSAAQKDFVVLAVRTPQRDSQGDEKRGPNSSASGAGSSLDELDVEWVTEHARQVSRMLPGGLSVLGVFLLTPPELAKEAQNTLRRLVFAVDKVISRGRLWSLSEDDITDRVTLHICSKTRKVVCRTFDVGDLKSSAKPADWKYQPGVCLSWSMLVCSVELDLLVPLTSTHLPPVDMERCIKEGLQTWAHQIEAGVCLLNGRSLPDDAELVGGGGQKRNVRTVQQTFTVQLLVTATAPQPEQTTAQVQVCEGSVRLRGVVSCRAFLHNNKPRAKLASELIKRDIISTVTSRVEMLLEDLLMNEEQDRAPASGQQVLPRRVFAPTPCRGVCLCDYMFPDECVADVSERIKEMLDWDTPPEDIDTTQEVSTEPSCLIPWEPEKEDPKEGKPNVETDRVAVPATPPKSQSNAQYYAGVAMAAAVALLATATSLLYLSD